MKCPNHVVSKVGFLIALFLGSVNAWSQLALQDTRVANSNAPRRSKGATEITANKSAAFDGQKSMAVFIGDVHVVDTQFELTSEKLTAFLSKQAASSQENASTAKTDKDPKGGLERVIAEGNVIIVQEHPGEKPGETNRYVAKGAKAEYDAKTQELRLSGWPQIQQGINTHISTSENTVMYLNCNGQMRTEGSSKTVIQEEVPERTKRP